jgi:hypothetical protein
MDNAFVASHTVINDPNAGGYQEWVVYPHVPVYEVHRTGVIRRVQEDSSKPPHKLLAQWLTNTGKLCVTLHQNGNKQGSPTMLRVMAETFLGEPSNPDMLARCMNGDQKDTRLENVQWATYSEINKAINNFKREGLNRPYIATHVTTGEKKRLNSKKEAEVDSGVGRKAFNTAVKKQKTLGGWLWEQVDDVQPSAESEIKPIPGYPDCKASSDGLIWKKTTGWTRGSLATGGKYYRIGFDKSEERVSRLIAQTFLGAPAQGNSVVNHIDGKDSLNNAVTNLEWMSIKENCQHAADTGLTDNKVPVRQIKD